MARRSQRQRATAAPPPAPSLLSSALVILSEEHRDDTKDLGQLRAAKPLPVPHPRSTLSNDRLYALLALHHWHT